MINSEGMQGKILDEYGATTTLQLENFFEVFRKKNSKVRDFLNIYTP